MEFTIQYATRSDTDNIMRFIDLYWRKGHILSRNKELFLWQYGGDDDRLNIIIGKDLSGTIQGMLGFIPYDRKADKDLSLALWKSNPAATFLGIKLLLFLKNKEPHREIVCPGINMKTTSQIYERMGMEVGTMNHWYRLAPNETYSIAKITNNTVPDYFGEITKLVLTKVESIASLVELFCPDTNTDYLQSIPFKSIPYIKWRYFEHPIYTYHLYAIHNPINNSRTLIALRVQDCNGSRALRLIDCIGCTENIKYLTPEFDKLLKYFNCEYIDMYESGMTPGMIESCGWRRVTNDGNIIPDYFSPYECRNVDIHYTTSFSSAILLKGDGDQDRPN